MSSVVPKYCVSYMSNNKLIKDSKLSVGFDEATCYIQDLKKQSVLRLVVVYTCLIKTVACLLVWFKVSFFVCHVSKEVWHNRLGHRANQVLKLLKKLS